MSASAQCLGLDARMWYVIILECLVISGKVVFLSAILGSYSNQNCLVMIMPNLTCKKVPKKLMQFTFTVRVIFK